MTETRKPDWPKTHSPTNTEQAVPISSLQKDVVA